MIKKFTFIIFLLNFTFSLVYSQGIPPGYYNSANGLNCQSLKTELSNITSAGQIQLIYGQLDDFQMPVVDTIPNDAGTSPIVWDIYSNNNIGPEPFVYNMTQSSAGGFCGSTTPATEGVCWNKEHTFPRSWFRLGTGGPYQQPTDADLINVRPVDSRINTRRASVPYANVGTPTFQFPTAGAYSGYPMPPNPVLVKIGPSNVTGVSIATAFEPSNFIKGDIARAYFYLMTRYETSLSTWLSFNTGGGIEKVLDAANPVYPSFNLSYLAMLYNWHLIDPVDAKEINRNNLIYTQQNNRNPYVDHPEYVAMVWQCSGVIPVTLTQFSAQLGNETVYLNWNATFENNFRMFNIERSTDGVVFNTIGSVSGQNLSNYAYNDYQLPLAPYIYYRLKMLDIDGKFSYSKTVVVKKSSLYADAVVFPNPTAGMLSIKMTEQTGLTDMLQIFDIAGRTVKSFRLSSGLYQVQVNVHDLSTGKYFIKIFNNKGVIHQTFVKIK